MNESQKSQAARSAGGRDAQDQENSTPAPWWRPLLWVLVAGSVFLVVLSAVVPVLLGAEPGDRSSPIREFFDVSGERNLPAWWNSGLLLLAAFFSAAVGTLRHRSGAAGRLGWLSWWGLAALLGLMSLDEFAGFHERLDVVWRMAFGDNPLRAYEWLMLGVPLALAVLLFVFLCARSLPRATARLLVLGMLVFFTGALFFESIPLIFDLHRNTVAHVASYHVEELLEFVGASLLVVAPLAAARVSRIAGSAGLYVHWNSKAP